jgi:hypothetical protein
MNKVVIELEFDNAPTELDVYEYLYDLMEARELDYTVEGELENA